MLAVWLVTCPEAAAGAAEGVEAASSFAARATNNVDAKPARTSARMRIQMKGLGFEANPNEILAGVEPAGLNHLPIVGEHAAKVKGLPPIHKDPFDRLLIAQARFEPMILLTDDDVLGGYGEFVEVV